MNDNAVPTATRFPPLPLRLRLIRALLGLAAACTRAILPPAHRFRPDTRTPIARERILIVRLDELGDMVLFSGFFRELRRSRPDAHVTLVAKQIPAEIMAASPHIDEILTFDPGFHRAVRPFVLPFVAWRFVRKRLSGSSYHIAIQPRWDVDNTYAGWIVYFSGAASRIGYSEKTTLRKSVLSRGFDRLYTEVIDDPRRQHESDRATDLLQHLGIDGDASEPEVWPIPAPPERVAELLAPIAEREIAGDRTPLVAMSPSGGHSRYKQWPPHLFGEVVRELAKRRKASVVLLGSEAERPLTAEVIRSARVPVLDLAGSTSLSDIVAILDRSDLYVGGDTGLLYIAVARGIPTVSLYGSSTPYFVGPRSRSDFVVWNRLPCAPYPPGAETTPPPDAAAALRTERCFWCVYENPRCMDELPAGPVLTASFAALDRLGIPPAGWAERSVPGTAAHWHILGEGR